MICSSQDETSSVSRTVRGVQQVGKVRLLRYHVMIDIGDSSLLLHFHSGGSGKMVFKWCIPTSAEESPPWPLSMSEGVDWRINSGVGG